MKWYLSINILLVVLTYFFVEKDAVKKLGKNRQNDFLFSENLLKEQKEIQLNDFKLIKKKEWIFEDRHLDQLLDQQFVTNILSQLSNIKIQRTLPSEFSHNFLCSFRVGEYHFDIGEKVNYNDHFYVKLNGENFIVKDTTPQTHPLPKEIYRLNPYKHGKLLSFCKSDKIHLLKKYIFKDLDISNFKYSPSRGFVFSVDFKKFTGQPTPLNGHVYDKRKIAQFKKNLSMIQVDKYVIDRPFLDGEKIGQLEINNSKLDLFRADGQNFLFLEKESLWTKVENIDLINMYYQDLWDTKLLRAGQKNICLLEPDEQKLCFKYEKSLIKDIDRVDVNFEALNQLVYSLTKNSIMLKKLSVKQTFAFSYDKVLVLGTKKYLLKNSKRIITLVDVENNFQYEFLKYEKNVAVASSGKNRK